MGTSAIQTNGAFYTKDHPHAYGDKSVLVIFTSYLKDHPHAYGDKTVAAQESVLIPGSSPRVWGQASQYPQMRTIPRIIPTRMGTSLYPAFTPLSDRDHPHAYGDKCFSGSSARCSRGSSPRVWGQVVCPDNTVTDTGIIHTRMGTSKILVQ